MDRGEQSTEPEPEDEDVLDHVCDGDDDAG